jgi:hypothetical protein
MTLEETRALREAVEEARRKQQPRCLPEPEGKDSLTLCGDWVPKLDGMAGPAT